MLVWPFLSQFLFIYYLIISLIVLFIYFFFVWNVNVYLIVCVKRLEQYGIGNIQILIIIIMYLETEKGQAGLP